MIFVLYIQFVLVTVILNCVLILIILTMIIKYLNFKYIIFTSQNYRPTSTLPVVPLDYFT